MISILAMPEKHWVCPNCDVTQVTREPRPHTPFHPCAGLCGLTAPFVEEGEQCDIRAVDREDYIGREQVQFDAEGRAKMAVITTRNDGQDVAVLAPVASAEMES
jgi:hypothetical protein